MQLVNPEGARGDAASAIAQTGAGCCARKSGIVPTGTSSSVSAIPQTTPPGTAPSKSAATYDAETGAWSARVGEQNLNEQRGDWEPELVDADGAPRFPTAAACLGDAVARLMTVVDQDARDTP